MKTCSVDGCDKAHASKGLCGMHYARLKRAGTTDDPVYVERKCGIDGCDEKHFGNGLCKAHYYFSRKEDIAGKSKKWREDNKEVIKEKNAARYQATKDIHMEKWRMRMQNETSAQREKRLTQKKEYGRGYRERTKERERVGYQNKVCGRIVEGFGENPSIVKMDCLTRVCTGCGERRHVSGFCKKGSGSAAICKPCKKEVDRLYQANNIEAVREYRRKHNELPSTKENNKRYRKENREKIKEAYIEWREKINYKESDGYIKASIEKHSGVKNPPQELIELKRVQLKIYRGIKTNEYS